MYVHANCLYCSTCSCIPPYMSQHPYYAAFLPGGGNRVITSSEDGTMKLWSLHGKGLGTLRASSSSSSSSHNNNRSTSGGDSMYPPGRPVFTRDGSALVSLAPATRGAVLAWDLRRCERTDLTVPEEQGPNYRYRARMPQARRRGRVDEEEEEEAEDSSLLTSLALSPLGEIMAVADVTGRISILV